MNIRKSLERFMTKRYENSIVNFSFKLCKKPIHGYCLREKCPYFMSRNPFGYRACLPNERFESCPIMDFSQIILRKRYLEMKKKREEAEK